MLPTKVQYSIIAAGVLTVTVVSAIYLWPERRPDSPEVLFQRILSSKSVEEQAQAAEDMIYHGEAARGYAGEALTRYEGDAPEVILPLLQATMKARDWRHLPRVFDLMEHDNSKIRGRAGVAARKILGADYFFRANDPPEKRAALLEQMRKDFEEAKPFYEDYYPYPK
jgi:hypothetical protein